MSNTIDTDQVVRQRYSSAAMSREEELCCPVEYDREYLKAIPQEVIDRDYGCGDPSKYLRPGETVLDLGSGGGKICFIAAQVVGAEGRIIGVDKNDEMLELARRSRAEVSRRIGYENVEFFKGRIQDLAVDRDKVDAFLKSHPVYDETGLRRLESFISELRADSPMIADESIDVVVSNCVLNLVDADEKAALFREIYRVLRRGGRAVISDIVSDEPVPMHLQKDPQLWSGCLSGAFQEAEFLQAFENAGFYGINMESLQKEPWRTVEGIEFRSATVVAFKGKDGPCDDHHEAVIYRGPFRSVFDDDGHEYPRGQRVAVCRKTFSILAGEPYDRHFIPIPPHTAIAEEEARPMSCDGLVRSPHVTKGANFNATSETNNQCDDDGCC